MVIVWIQICIYLIFCDWFFKKQMERICTSNIRMCQIKSEQKAQNGVTKFISNIISISARSHVPLFHQVVAVYLFADIVQKISARVKTQQHFNEFFNWLKIIRLDDNVTTPT